MSYSFLPPAQGQRPTGPRPRQRPQQQQEAPQVPKEGAPRPLGQEEAGVELGEQTPQVAEKGTSMILRSASLLSIHLSTEILVAP